MEKSPVRERGFRNPGMTLSACPFRPALSACLDALSRGPAWFLIAVPVCAVTLAHGIGEWGETGLPAAVFMEGFGEGG